MPADATRTPVPAEPGWAAERPAASLQADLRPSCWSRAPGRCDNEPVRALSVLLAVLGGLALAAAVPISLALGQNAEAGWLLIGPLPFYLIGLAGFRRRPDNPVVQWLLWVGVGFVVWPTVRPPCRSGPTR
jgi:hypothetical protein